MTDTDSIVREVSLLLCKHMKHVTLLGCLALGACTSLAAPVNNVAGQPYLVKPATLISAYGCRYEAIYRQPAESTVPFTVVLGHGFLRQQKYLQDMSEAMVTAGIPVITLDFCAMRLWSGNHLTNGAEMRTVARYYKAERVVFAGHSAGGLAALVAASEYKNTVGVVLLDFVDQPPIGVNALQTIEAPLIALFGAPSSCNVQGRDLALIQRTANASVEIIAGASHCAFESPTSRLCRWVCARRSGDESETQRKIIVRTVDALFALAHQRAANGNTQWVTGSDYSAKQENAVQTFIAAAQVAVNTS